jgi:hypothetical protein
MIVARLDRVQCVAKNGSALERPVSVSRNGPPVPENLLSIGQIQELDELDVRDSLPYVAYLAEDVGGRFDGLRFSVHVFPSLCVDAETYSSLA